MFFPYADIRDKYAVGKLISGEISPDVPTAPPADERRRIIKKQVSDPLYFHSYI